MQITKERLAQLLKDIPSEPGCYLMKDKTDRLLYVGKSKNLKQRVRSYFRNQQDHTPRIRLMVMQIHDIEFIVTDSEDEALVLESNIIKNSQPHFNILLKDDKKYPYLCITWSEEYPRVFITRRRRFRSSKDRFYGPYVDVTLLRKTLFFVKRVFPLRQRPIPLHSDRTCLNYSIGRCPGVCQKLIKPEEYEKTIQKVSMVFQGRTDELENLLRQQMQSYSERLEFERAAELRDQLEALDKLTAEQKMGIGDSSVTKDIIAIADDNRIASVQIFQMRGGKLIGRLAFTSDANTDDKGLIIQRVIEHHYGQIDNLEIPPDIVVQHSLPNNIIVSKWLTEQRGRKVRITCPSRRNKTDLIDLVARNAAYELKRTQKGLDKNLLEIEDLAQLLQLTIAPRRIEGYDISHIQGSDAVGSQVVFIDGMPAKHQYRKYKIKDSTITTGHSDDYKALAEIITRRFKRWSSLKSQGLDINTIHDQKIGSIFKQGTNDWPDLVMIDGGKGQLSSVYDALKNLNLHEDVNICSLAKRKEQIFLPGQTTAVNSEPDQLGVLLLRRLRDEAHRFAIGFHRQQRTNRQTRSRLNDIPGLGPKRIKHILMHFNSVEAIQMATLDQLKETPGLGHSIASEIWTYFHPSQKD